MKEVVTWTCWSEEAVAWFTWSEEAFAWTTWIASKRVVWLLFLIDVKELGLEKILDANFDALSSIFREVLEEDMFVNNTGDVNDEDNTDHDDAPDETSK